jgi:MFS family permease
MTVLTPQPTRHPAPATVRRATTAVFALNGFLFATWAVRVPDVSEHVGASHGALGFALLCISVGALATMRLAGAVCDRLGAGLVTALAATLVALALPAPGLASSVPALCLALTVFGAASGVLNVAMNSVGVALERLGGRPLLPALHAAFSFGGLAGGLLGGLAAAVVDAGTHLVAAAVVALVAAAALARPLLATDARRSRVGSPHVRPDARPRPGATVVALGAIAGCAAYGEGALADWGALHLVDSLDAPSAIAAGGYSAFCLAMGVGRLAGHRLLDLLGGTRLLAGGSLVAALGMLLGALAPSLEAAVAGFLLVGLGLANVFPVAIARAGALAGSRGVGLASTVGYGGLLLGPAAIGFLASHGGLPIALATVSVLAVVAAGLALRVRDDAHQPLRWLVWSAPEALARLRTRLAPVAAGMRTAADRHASSLTLLVDQAPENHAAPDRIAATPLESLLGGRVS